MPRKICWHYVFNVFFPPHFKFFSPLFVIFSKHAYIHAQKPSSIQACKESSAAISHTGYNLFNPRGSSKFIDLLIVFFYFPLGKFTSDAPVCVELSPVSHPGLQLIPDTLAPCTCDSESSLPELQPSHCRPTRLSYDKAWE